MSIFEAIILAIVEGITEFLPISSTGHLILTSHLLKIQQTEFVKSFEIIIQLGAISAVIFLYWRTLISKITLWKKILVAFIPSATIGFILYSFIKTVLLGNPYITVIMLLLGGILLILLEFIHKEKKQYEENLSNISLKNALIIGIFQTVSIVPGVSRSGATIIGGLLVGLERKTAVEFSFLLAIPTMLAATALDLFKSRLIFNLDEIILLIIGLLGSFLVALTAISFLLRFIKNHSFIPFGIYRIFLSLLYWFFIL